jgi:hypothetical protein
MLRITKLEENGAGVMLKVEGQVVSDWVSELEHECRRWGTLPVHVCLDFRDVTWIDRHGLRRLRALCGAAVEIVNCPPLIQELLDQTATD